MAGDPYKYFKIEAREILGGLSGGLLELERGDGSEEVVVRMLRLAHTLKGASRVVKQPGIAALAHGFEEKLGPHRDGGGAVPEHTLRELLSVLGELEAAVSALEARAAVGTPDASAGARGEAPSDAARGAQAADVAAPPVTARVELGELDDLLDAVAETSAQLGALHRAEAELGAARALVAGWVDTLVRENGTELEARHARAEALQLADDVAAALERGARGLSIGLGHVRAELGKVREAAHRLRLVPAGALFEPLERAARDAAHATGKQIVFETGGASLRVDAQVLAEVRAALLHVVINAVAHGIEAKAARQRAGKSAAGAIRVTVARRGDEVVFACADDGRGIDVAAVREAAARRGLVDSGVAATLGADEVVALLGRGISTMASVSEVAGRGLGLEIVRATAVKLRGRLRIETTPGRGTVVEVIVPAAIAAVEALLVHAGGVSASIPLDAITHAKRLVAADVSRTGGRDAIVHEGEVIPYVPLARVLARGVPGATPRGAFSAVVVRAGDRAAAMGVDRLLGTARVVVRSVPARALTSHVVAGASLDADGNPELVLDPEALVREAEQLAGAHVPTADTRTRPILVIDDSLTTRMLEQSILESAGYEVDLASSAEEALVKARARAYALFLCDVEMPGMDGFAFVTQTRADPELARTPAILVTSRSSDEDKARGAEAGASAYVVKSEFDQGRLLEIIAALVGPP